jgi:hypothetical protein
LGGRAPYLLDLFRKSAKQISAFRDKEFIEGLNRGFTGTKTKWRFLMADNVCRAGARYLHNVFVDGKKSAGECAKKLTKESENGTKYCTVTKTVNISDGLPARVMVTYAEVISGKKCVAK